MAISKRVRIAIEAPAKDLAAAGTIPDTHTFRDKKFVIRVSYAPSLSHGERQAVWDLWETNMRAMVEPSSFGWNPNEKRKELFHRHARFILVYGSSDAQEPTVPTSLAAFSMFRFEQDEGEDVIYCYELQVSQPYRSSGLGRFLVEKLTAIGKHWKMSKLMLTVLKSNTAARRFYQETGFEVDPSSPEYEPTSEDDVWVDEDGSDTETYDYEILSKALN
ncbi:acyl-CoA N-acyltransferase [Trametes polyzona]|nr:acyl-CoA N-acyltransferase [Trametes polyzona]